MTKPYQTSQNTNSRITLSSLQANNFLYQAYYCEENIWQLCQQEPFKQSDVIFIASKGEAFPMLQQRAMSDPNTPLLWDYHVILMTNTSPRYIVDFDTTLPFCSPLTQYLHHSFLDERYLPSEYIPYFRVITAQDYTQQFCSNRSHMKTEQGWSAPPPDWPIIGDGSSNLAKFIDMNDHTIGKVVSYAELASRHESAIF